MKKTGLILITFCLIFCIFAIPSFGEERSLTYYSLTIDSAMLFPICTSEKETENNWAYNYGFGFGISPWGVVYLGMGGIRFLNGDIGSRSFERLDLLALGPFNNMLYRLSATFGYEWVNDANDHSFILEGGWGMNFFEGNTVISPLVRVGYTKRRD